MTPAVVIKGYTPTNTGTSQSMTWDWCPVHQGWHLEPACELSPEAKRIREMVDRHIQKFREVFERLADS